MQKVALEEKIIFNFPFFYRFRLLKQYSKKAEAFKRYKWIT